MKKIISAVIVLLGLFSHSPYAMAQMNNKPFSFKGTARGGAGISLGGKQAILNDKIYDSTPKNLVRGSDGALLNITKGPGNSALISTPDGNFIPSFREHSFKDGNTGMSAGVFNAYFIQNSNTDEKSSFGQEVSSAVVNTWTARVISGGTPVSYSPNSTVDMWTGMVYVSY